jgi:hypothetical protein
MSPEQRVGKFTVRDWLVYWDGKQQHKMRNRVEEHVRATDFAAAVADATREREQQEANTRKWTEERKRAEQKRAAEVERRRQHDVAVLRAEKREDEERRRTIGR